MFAQHLCLPHAEANASLQRLSQQLAPTDFTPEQLLAVYRNNFVVSLKQVLAQLFPVTQALVGEAFFTQTSRQFVLTQALEQPHLDTYGGLFVDYLSQLKALEKMPFITKMAEVEWQLDRIGHIYYQPKFDFNSLQQVPQEHHLNTIFSLSSTCHLVAANMDLIQLHQHLAPTADGSQASLTETCDYQQQCQLMILQNQQGESALMAVQALHWQWLKGLENGLTLDQLCAIPHTELAQLMTQITDWIALGCIDGFTVSSST